MLYEVKKSERKATPYIKEGARLWLIEKICADRYKAFGADARELLDRVKQQNMMSKNNMSVDDYDAFTGYCSECQPHDYIFQKGKFKRFIPRSDRADANRIFSDDISCYMVKFQESIVPLGFIRDFYEDDYELQEELSKLYSDFVGHAYNEFNSSRERFGRKFKDDVKRLGREHDKIFPQRSRTFKEHLNEFKTHFVNLVFKMLLPLAVLWIAITGVAPYVKELLETRHITFTRESFLVLIVNAVILLLLIAPVIKAVRLAVCYIRVIAAKIRLCVAKLKFGVIYGMAHSVLSKHYVKVGKKLKKDPVIKKEYTVTLREKEPEQPVARYLFRILRTLKFELCRSLYRSVKVYNYNKLAPSRLRTSLVYKKSKIFLGTVYLLLLLSIAFGVNKYGIPAFLLSFL